MPPLIKPIIVALSGPTSSGKTTIAASLNNLFSNSILVHLDDFYLPEKLIPFDEERNEPNWDCPEALDFKLFSNFIHQAKEKGIEQVKNIHTKSYEGDINLKLTDKEISDISKTLTNYQNIPIVFVEGFMLFHNPDIISLFDVRLFFYAPYNILKERREERKYNTDAGVWVDPPGYFDKMVWPEYVKHHNYLFENNNVNKDLNNYATNDLHIIPHRSDGKASLSELVIWTVNQIPLN